MSKSSIRKAKANGSTKAKIDKLMRRGWAPGKAIGPLSWKAGR